MISNKITLFTSSSISLSLINYLVSKNTLACIVITNRVDADAQMLLQNIIQMNIPYFQYLDKDDNQNIEILKKVDTNLAIIFGFSHKLSENISKYFNSNIFNIHPSSLPKYRGSQALFWQLKNGEKSITLTIHKITQIFDAGDIIIQKSFDIDPKDTMGIVMGIISQLVINLVDEFLELLKQYAYDNTKVPAIAQIGDVSKAPNIERKDISINWDTMNSNDIVNLIRACNPIFGGAQTLWKNSYISILEATVVDMLNLGLDAGYILHIGYPEGLIVATIDGSIRVDIVSVPDGTFSGLRFAKRFKVDAGEQFITIN